MTAVAMAAAVAVPLGVGSPVAASCPSASASLSGTGTATDPYLIQSTDDLLRLSQTSSLWSGNHVFKQTNDVVLTGCTWSPIGTLGSPFTGTYEGDGRRIYDLSHSGSEYVAMFGYAEDTTISDLALIEPDITASSGRSGVLVGVLMDDSTVSGITVTDAVVTGGGQAVGGLIGQAQADAAGSTLEISDVTISGQVTTTGGTSRTGLGGVVGSLAAGNPGAVRNGSVVVDDVTVAVDMSCTSSAFTSYSGGVFGVVNAYESASVALSNIVSTGDATEACTGGYTGGVIGYARGFGGSLSISSVQAAGPVQATGNAGGLVGGTVAQNVSSSPGQVTLSNSVALGAVAADSGPAGGLVGSVTAIGGAEVAIRTSFALGSVTNRSSNARDGFGGLIGKAETSGSPAGTVIVADTSASGTVSGEINKAGGLIGSISAGVTVTDSYSVGAVEPGGGSDSGGLIGMSAGTVTESFWDTETSGISTSAAGTGKTTAELQALSTFSSIWSIANESFDQQKTWLICGGIYPLLMWASMGLLQGCAPTGVAATGVDGTASVSWIAPGIFSADPITSYTVTAAPGGASCTATAPAVTCDVTGLTVGTSYTFSVTATDGTITGPAGVSAAFDMTATPAPATTVPATTVPATTVPAAEQAPVRDVDGNLPSVSDPSKATMVVNGVVSFLDVAVVDESRLVVSGDGFEMALAGSNTAGESSKAGDSGRLEVTDGGLLQVSGTGFDPGSEVDIWVMSDPVFAGTVTVGADGSFAGSVPVPEGLVVGPHTVQANGVTADGVARSLNLGIELVSSAVLPATGGSFPVAPVMVLLLAAGAVLVVTARRRSIV
jgi:hypothetical protein